MTSIHDMLEKKNAAKGVLVMGIVNTAPDSFSDGNDGINPVDKALRLIDDGADIIDIGGESTRPGAEEIPLEIEIERVKNVLQQIKKLRPSVIASIDTRKSKCAEVMLELGADIINDVSGLAYSNDMAQTVAAFNANLIIMHSLGKGISNIRANYNNVAEEVFDFLKQQKDYALSCGIHADKIAVDPGLGFSKNTEENCILLKNIKKFTSLAVVLIGASRKRFVRELAGIDSPADSDPYSAFIAAQSVLEGSKMIRVHTVRETLKVLNMIDKIRSGDNESCKFIEFIQYDYSCAGNSDNNYINLLSAVLFAKNQNRFCPFRYDFSSGGNNSAFSAAQLFNPVQSVE